MELNITSEQENPLFNRKEILATVDAEITPKKQEIEQLLTQKFSTQPDSIVIKKILGKFGSKTFQINASVYKSKEDKEKTEPKSKKSSQNTVEATPTNTEQNAPKNDSLTNKENPSPTSEAKSE